MDVDETRKGFVYEIAMCNGRTRGLNGTKISGH